MQKLSGKIALVAGASRGAGKGIALALGEAGATVYVCGRTKRGGARPLDGVPGTIEDTAEELTARGGEGIPVCANLTRPEEVRSAFSQVDAGHGKLDILANAVWGGNDSIKGFDDWQKEMRKPFWDQPVSLWQNMMGAGPMACYLASQEAAKRMAGSGGGLIASVTDGVIEGQDSEAFPGQLIWDLAHQSINKLMQGMAAEGKESNIAFVTLMPGFMRTERVLKYLDTDKKKKMFGFEKSETPEYLGRAVAALAADEQVIRKSGMIHFVADLAREYGFTDVDGRQIPRFDPFG